MKKWMIAAAAGTALLAVHAPVFATTQGDVAAATMFGAIAALMLSQDDGPSYYYGYPAYAGPAYYRAPHWGGHRWKGRHHWEGGHRWGGGNHLGLAHVEGLHGGSFRGGHAHHR